MNYIHVARNKGLGKGSLQDERIEFGILVSVAVIAKQRRPCRCKYVVT